MQSHPLAAAMTVTDWPQRVALTLLVCALIVVVLALMRWGWVRKAGRQSDVASLPAVPSAPRVAGSEPGSVVCADARYLGATRSGDWLDRVVVHGLGVPSKAQVVASHQGVWIFRAGAPDLFITAGEVAQVRHDRAAAGRVLEADGVLLITWRHCGALIDLGLRVPDPSGAESLRATIADASRCSNTPSTANSGDPA